MGLCHPICSYNNIPGLSDEEKRKYRKDDKNEWRKKFPLTKTERGLITAMFFLSPLTAPIGLGLLLTGWINRGKND